MYYLIALGITLSILFVLAIFYVNNLTSKYNHIEPVYCVDKTIIVVDVFTAHRLKFKLGNDNKHIKILYDKDPILMKSFLNDEYLSGKFFDHEAEGWNLSKIDD
jgi:hypothetical protein